MKLTNLESFYALMEQDKKGDIVNSIYKDFLGPNFLTTEKVLDFIESYQNELYKKNEYYFECLGVDEYNKAGFIYSECKFLREILLAFNMLSKPIEFLYDNDLCDLVSQFENSTAELEYFLRENEVKLQSNYDIKYPATVSNLISHIRQLLFLIRNFCDQAGFEFNDTPFYNIVTEWLLEMDKLYSVEKLKLRLELAKQGPHHLHTVALKKLLFEDLFLSREDYIKIKEILILENLIERSSGFWIDENNGTKSLIVVIMKQLINKNYFRRDIKIDEHVIQTVSKNSFNVDISSAFIARIRHNEVSIKFIPDRTEAPISH